MSYTQNKKFDLLLIVIFQPIAAIISVLTRATYLESLILFLAVPALYLSIRQPRLIKKILIFSVFFSLPPGIIIDYLVTKDQGWTVLFTFFPRFLGVVPVEDLVFGFLSVYAIVIMYEYFFDKGKNNFIENKFKYFLVSCAVFLIIFLSIYVFIPNILLIPYAFLLICSIFFLLPLIIFLIKHTFLVNKYAKVGLYFFFTSLLFEPIAIYLGQWTYVGSNYIGWLEILKFKIPLEEFIFFWILYAPAVLTWYELFDDDMK